jgi:hypothetical protein
MTVDSIRRAIRTFLIATLALFLPGLLGWLNALTEWARGEGSTPFPDAHGLAYLGVAAITAGVIAIVNLLWNAVENGIGHGLLRDVPPRPSPGQGGAVTRGVGIGTLVGIVVLVVLLVWLL